MPRDWRNFKGYSGSRTQRRQALVRGYQATRAARPRPMVAVAAGEMKYFDVENTGTAVGVVGATNWASGNRLDPTSTVNIGAAAVGTPLCLFAPTVGSALNQRIGRSVYIKKVKFRGVVVVPNQAAQSAADAPTTLRLMLVLDQQTNAAQLTAPDVIQPGTAVRSTVNGYLNPNGFGRFRILKERYLSIGDMNLANDTGATGGLVQAGRNYNVKFSYTFKTPLKVQFNSTNGGTVADIIDNSLHILAGVADATYVPALSYYCRVAYTE